MATHAHQADSAAAPPQGKKGTEGRSHSTLHTPQSAFKWALMLLPFGYLWFRLIDNLRLEWSTDPQYGYGWVVPLLCIGLLIRRWHAVRTTRLQDYETTGPQDRRSVVSGPRKAAEQPRGEQWSVVLLFAFLAFLYLPTRLIEAAVPEWRPIQWSLDIIAIGLTLCAIYARKGGSWLRQTAFPICFLLVAVPWPTLIEGPIIQGLTRLNSGIVVEVLGVLGVPALQHGNVIEVSTGMVGIDDACSGIRSFQSSLMISLFFGEFYRFGLLKRLLLVPVGFILAIAFNVLRTSILTLVAAKKGVAAISEYHDSTGITILLTCTAVMWGVAILLRSPQSTVQSLKLEEGESKTTDHKTTDHETADNGTTKLRGGQWSVVSSPWSVVRGLALSLLIWLIMVEAGVQIWYRSRESHLVPTPNWSVVFPQDNPTFKDLPINAKTANLLRFDEGQQGGWREPDGTEWQAFYFNWHAGRVAGYLAKRHTPDICMPAAGQKLISGPELLPLNVHGVELPMRCYVFETGAGLLHVFQCRWEAGASREDYVQQESARFNLLRGVWAGRGRNGQKVLEVIVEGLPDAAQAKAALIRELDKLIKVEGAKAESRNADPRSNGFALHRSRPVK